MKKILALLFAALILNGCTPSKKQTPRSILASLLEKNARHTSISYYVKYRVKYFSKTDTIQLLSNCTLIKDRKDTLFGGYVLFSTKRWHDTKYFDLDSIYYISDSLKTITTYNKPKTEYWAITGNISGDIIKTFFLDTLVIHKALRDTSLIEKISKDKIGDKEYWKVIIKYKDDKELSNKWRSIWINPIDSTLKKIAFHCTFQGEDEYDEWNLDSIQYDKETPQSLQALMKGRFSTYATKRYTPPDPESEKPLANGTKAPAFSGIDFASNKKVSLIDYKGKIVLLDFWYMDCYWCIQAMPLLEKVSDEFSKKGLVALGINSHDTTNEGKQKLPGFIKINKNTYPTILTARSTDNAYNVHAYPTFYLIDRKGKVVFSERGYRKNLDSVLESEINKIH